SQDLLNRNYFFNNPYTAPYLQTSPSGTFNPWNQDTPSFGGDWATPVVTVNGNTTYPGVTRQFTPGPGLPVCYDPLWRCVTGSYPDHVNGTASKVGPFEGRFGAGITLRALGSARGLQRVSNLQALFSTGIIPQSTALPPQILQHTTRVLNTFVSPEDLVLQEKSGDYLDPNTSNPAKNVRVKLTSPSTVVPSLSDSSGGGFNLSPTSDWRFTWFVTGVQTDSKGESFDLDLVVCENRPFGIDSVTVGNTTVPQVSGETVVEAIWGYSASPGFLYTGSALGYGNTSSSRSVVLRWPNTQPDPEIKVGNWIADVTYVRDSVSEGSYKLINNTYNGIMPAQRCNWYTVAKKSDAAAGPTIAGVAYRQMTVWTSTPLRAQSLLDFSTTPPSPQFVEAALIMPSVVNVYSVPVTVKSPTY
ncbi:MAG: hypothetical protein LC745_12790, partial [Planctomycetia bacterium]|nr:hypothetical protein [Planctomycetia bacterium]